MSRWPVFANRRLCAVRARAAASLLVSAGLGGCQDYPFETREPVEINARQITENITAVAPSDILFVLDNSGSMMDELESLSANIRTFTELLSESENDYRIGFLAPDIECNVPERDCDAAPTSSAACCAVGPTSDCTESDLDGDGKLDVSTCDGGRLRSIADRQVTSTADRGRFFDRPDPEDIEPWLQDINDTIFSLGCAGSGYEGTLEVVRRAVVCSLSETQREQRELREVDADTSEVLFDACPDPKIAELNAGFIRDNADLVLIFVTDEDDCSHLETLEQGEDPANGAVSTAYKRLTNNLSPTEQQAKYCSPAECYAYLGRNLDIAPANGTPDWIEGSDAFDCQSGIPRTEYPPDPTPVDDFLDDLEKAKVGGISRIRGGGILGGVRDTAAPGPVDFTKTGCFTDISGPADSCGCWANGSDAVYCELTGLVQSQPLPTPPGTDVPVCGGGTQTSLDGCVAMPSSRITDFLNLVAERRLAQDLEQSVLVDSICQPLYDQTVRDIVNTIFSSPCYDLGVPNLDPDRIQVHLNGVPLDYVSPTSALQGWTQPENSDEICLRNLDDITVGDRFEILLLLDD